jgi:4-amino-4-deoxy-L-arabinose transferase-like glycosyltransferase
MEPRSEEHKALAELFAGWRFALVVLVYFSLLFVLRGMLFRGAAMDEADELFFAQTLQAGYMFRNPPLFTWLLLLIERLVPANESLPVLIRYLSLAAAYIFLHRAALRIFSDRRVAVIAALSPVALYLIGWRMITTYPHSALLLAACAATFFFILRLRENPSTNRYVALGLAMGMGLLAKYNYGLFATTLIAAACFDRDLRRVLVTPRFILSVAIALLLFSPHAAWLVHHRAESAYVAQRRLGTAESWSDLGKRAYALYALGRSMLEFIVPLLVLIPFALRRNGSFGANDETSRDIGRWISRSLILQLSLLAIAAFLLGAVQIRVHHVITLVLFPFALLPFFSHRVHPRRMIAILGALGVAIVPLAAFDLSRTAQCSSDRLRQVDYRELAAALGRERADRGTVVVIERGYPISGSLRPYLPAARIQSTKWPEFESHRRARATTSVFLWRRGALDPAFAKPLQEHVATHPSLVVGSVEVAARTGGTVTFGYLVLRPSNPSEADEAMRLANEVLAQTSAERGWRNG